MGRTRKKSRYAGPMEKHRHEPMSNATLNTATRSARGHGTRLETAAEMPNLYR
jgi:hypothetical protein